MKVLWGGNWVKHQLKPHVAAFSCHIARRDLEGETSLDMGVCVCVRPHNFWYINYQQVVQDLFGKWSYIEPGGDVLSFRFVFCCRSSSSAWVLVASISFFAVSSSVFKFWISKSFAKISVFFSCNFSSCSCRSSKFSARAPLGLFEPAIIFAVLGRPSVAVKTIVPLVSGLIVPLIVFWSLPATAGRCLLLLLLLLVDLPHLNVCYCCGLLLCSCLCLPLLLHQCGLLLCLTLGLGLLHHCLLGFYLTLSLSQNTSCRCQEVIPFMEWVIYIYNNI